MDTSGSRETAAHPRRLVAVTASTGYIGAHLLAPLAEAGYHVRAIARTPARLAGRVPEGVEVFGADALDAVAVRASLQDVDTAFYLVHFLGQDKDYAELDRRGAVIFARAAAEARVRRIVFLGGLGEDGSLSEHLSSRHEVGEILASTGVPVLEFRASIVLGSGSTSFEMIRNLVEKLPVMTTPRWVRMPAQPIAVADVERYLVAAVEGPEPPRDPAEGAAHQVYEVGGPDRVSYGQLLSMYARHRGLRRLVIPVPVLSPGLSGWWLYLFTPRQARVGRQLAESLKFPTVVTDDSAARDFPGIRAMGAEEAMRRTFAAEDERFATMRWATELAGRDGPASFEMEGRYVDSRELRVACPPEAAFDPITCIGGERGWYAYDTLWDVRGFMDMMLGGPGRRRGRRDQYALVEGDYLEWWRVCTVEPPTFLRLEAEMKLPGRGWLQYELSRDSGEGGHGPSTIVRQTAVFDAKGVLGRLYWYAVLPLHHFVFRGTLAGIERECRALVEGPGTCPLPGEYERSLSERRRVATTA